MKLINEVLLLTICLNVCKSCDVEKLYTFEVPKNHPQCKEDFEDFVNSLRSNKSWAVESKWSWILFLNNWIKTFLLKSHFQFVLLTPILVACLTHMEICLTLVISTNVWVQTLKRETIINKNTAWFNSNRPQIRLSFRCYQVNLIFLFLCLW